MSHAKSGRPAGQAHHNPGSQSPGRVLALDVGERRIGVAVSDPSGTLATPHNVIQRRSKAQDFATIAQLVDEMEIERVVVGLPLSLSGDMGPQARRVTRYARALAQSLDVPIDLYDERYSTVTATERLAASERKRGQVPIDAAAAAVILQDYLESKRRSEQNME
jgi:putative Holliday junction resolvase